MELLVEDPKLVNEDGTSHKIGSNSKVDRVKLQVDSQTKLSMSKNMVRPNFLAKSKLLAKSRSKLSFLTSNRAPDQSF